MRALLGHDEADPIPGALMATFELSLAPAANNLYRNRRRGRAKSALYRDWIRGELASLVAQRARPVEPPVAISVTLPERMRGDADGRLKAAIDLMRRAGVIEDDNREIVREIHVGFAAREGMQIVVEHLEAV